MKSMGTRKVVTLLYIMALIVAITLSAVTVNISKQVEEGFFNADNKYDVLIGEKGSSTQLLMSTLFFADKPLGTISMQYVEELKSRGDLDLVIPLALADNYRGASIVGTEDIFLKDYDLKEGTVFKNSFEAVVGYNVAKSYNIKIGDNLTTSHGVSGIGNSHEANPYTVVGLLEKTNTAYDNVIFSDIHSIWEAHDHEDEEVSTENHEDEHEDEHENSVTAIAIRSGSLAKANEILTKYNTDDGNTQAVNPTVVMRKLMQNIDLSKQIALLLSTIILILSGIIITIMTLLMLQGINKDIEILRFIGVDRKGIFKFIMYQTAVQVSTGVVISIALSRIVLYITNNVSNKMGIIIAFDKIYSSEIYIIFIVIILCTLPTLLYGLKKIKGEIKA